MKLQDELQQRPATVARRCASSPDFLSRSMKWSLLEPKSAVSVTIDLY